MFSKISVFLFIKLSAPKALQANFILTCYFLAHIFLSYSVSKYIVLSTTWMTFPSVKIFKIVNTVKTAQSFVTSFLFVRLKPKFALETDGLLAEKYLAITHHDSYTFWCMEIVSLGKTTSAIVGSYYWTFSLPKIINTSRRRLDIFLLFIRHLLDTTS